MRTLSFCLVFLFVTTPAVADEFHHEGFRFGQRAMGMGGAVTALPGEPEAAFYNPASLGFLGGSVFSGAMNFFGTEHRKRFGSLRTGKWFEPQDEDSDAFMALPSASVLSKALGDDEAHVLAFSTFLVDDTKEAFNSTLNEPLARDGFESIQYNSSHLLNDRILFIGGSYAWRMLPELSLGLSIFYARRDQQTSRQQSQIFHRVNATTNAPFETFLDVTNSSQLSDGALLARLGVLYQPDPMWSFGLSCSSQSISLHGDAELGFGLVSSGDPSDPAKLPIHVNDVRKGLTAKTVYPWNCRLGAAFQVPEAFTISLDGSAHLPVDYTRISGLAYGDRQAFNLDAQFPQQLSHELVVNAALGVEVLPSPRWPLRAGFFTNRSAAPDIDVYPVTSSPPQVDLYGVTLSAGYLGDERSINLGGEFQWGDGNEAIVSDIAGLIGEPTFVRIDRSQYRVLFFVSGAIDFAKKTATDVFSD